MDHLGMKMKAEKGYNKLDQLREELELVSALINLSKEIDALREKIFALEQFSIKMTGIGFDSALHPLQENEECFMESINNRVKMLSECNEKFNACLSQLNQLI